MSGFFSIPRKFRRLVTPVSPLVCVSLLFAVVGCDTGRKVEPEVKRPMIKESAGANRAGSMRQPMQETTARQKQLEFLHRMRAADPHFQAIDQAVMNERNEIGVVLNAYVALDDVPGIMRLIIKKMSAEFPTENLAIVAYAPSMPRTKLGTARLDNQTHRMSFSWAIRIPTPESESENVIEV